MLKRQKYEALQAILLKDEHLTKVIVSKFLTYPSFKALKTHCKSLEISCNGLVWLATWLSFIYLCSRESLYEIQVNLLFGLLIDILIVAVLKSICRRRRPTVPNDMLILGPDKFSFPSGHASRSAFITLFFISLSPVSQIWWLPLISWCLSVCLSRILIQRHYILDVAAGIAIGFIETFILKILWINESGSKMIINFIFSDEVANDSE